MKKYLLFVLLSMLCIVAMTQGVVSSSRHSSNKLINEAFQRGRSRGDFYEIRNTKEKAIDVDKMRAEIIKEGCIVGKYTTKTISRFGDVATTLSTMQFLPKDEYLSYLYYHLRYNDMASFEQLINKGIAYCYVNNISYTYFVKNDGISWSGEIINGLLDGNGVGYGKISNDRVVYFSGSFDKGIPIGKTKFQYYKLGNELSEYSSSNAYSMTSSIGRFGDDLASIMINDKYGFITREGKTAIDVKFNGVVAGFSNGRATVTNDKEEIIIDRTGKQVDLSARQKKIYADAKAEAERKAEEERQAKLEAERQKLLAEQKAEEERRAAEAKELAFQKRIEANKNTKLWSRGCRLCYRYPNGYEYVIGTLEEWNESRTKVKIKIVASPSSTRTLNGDLLEKNNTMWVSARNEGWHLALDEEITAALNNDNSVRSEYESSSSSSSSYSSDYSTCSRCGGRGVVQCSSCNGTGAWKESAGWDEDPTYKRCSNCNGKGSYTCYDCRGTGKR